MRRFYVSLLLLVLALSGCDQEALFEEFVPKEESILAKQLIAKLAAKDFPAIEAQLDAKLRTPDLRGKLEELARLLPEGDPKSVRTVGAHTSSMNSVTTYDLTFEYEYTNAWIIAFARLEGRDGKVTLQAIHLTPARQSLEATNRFTFAGKGLLHYVIFALAIVIPVLVIYALVLCARTTIPKRKWLWFLFIAVGLVQLQFNWATGAFGIKPISFALLGAGFVKAGPVAPYVFNLAFPLGAVIFLAKRSSFRKANAA